MKFIFVSIAKLCPIAVLHVELSKGEMSSQLNRPFTSNVVHGTGEAEGRSLLTWWLLSFAGVWTWLLDTARTSS